MFYISVCSEDEGFLFATSPLIPGGRVGGYRAGCFQAMRGFHPVIRRLGSAVSGCFPGGGRPMLLHIPCPLFHFGWGGRGFFRPRSVRL